MVGKRSDHIGPSAPRAKKMKGMWIGEEQLQEDVTNGSTCVLRGTYGDRFAIAKVLQKVQTNQVLPQFEAEVSILAAEQDIGPEILAVKTAEGSEMPDWGCDKSIWTEDNDSAYSVLVMADLKKEGMTEVEDLPESILSNDQKRRNIAIAIAKKQNDLLRVTFEKYKEVGYLHNDLRYVCYRNEKQEALFAMHNVFVNDTSAGKNYDNISNIEVRFIDFGQLLTVQEENKDRMFYKTEELEKDNNMQDDNLDEIIDSIKNAKCLGIHGT